LPDIFKKLPGTLSKHTIVKNKFSFSFLEGFGLGDEVCLFDTFIVTSRNHTLKFKELVYI
jgi:hypothetical protein